MAAWSFINGGFIEEEKAVLHFRDLSIQRGYGVFDFLRFAGWQPVYFEEHMERFRYSATKMHLTLAYDNEVLYSIVKELIQRNSLPAGGIRLTLTGGYSADGYHPGSPNLIISQHQFQSPAQNQVETGIRLLSYEHQRQLPSVKSIDYLMAIWLQPLLQQQQADDILYYNQGIITECPRANFFMVDHANKIITPARNILKGITRMKLISIASRYFELEERDISPEELGSAREAFITSTTKSILPVSQVDGYRFDKKRMVIPALTELVAGLHKTV
jgi:branched-chain amino acid aminotransferase